MKRIKKKKRLRTKVKRDMTKGFEIQIFYYY